MGKQSRLHPEDSRLSLESRKLKDGKVAVAHSTGAVPFSALIVTMRSHCLQGPQSCVY